MSRVVVMVGVKLAAHSVSERVSAPLSGTGIFGAETELPLARICWPDALPETGWDTKSPQFAGKIRECGTRSDPYELGGGRDRDRTCDPYHVKVVLSR